VYRREGKLREEICPGWKNDGRENVWGGKMTEGNMIVLGGETSRENIF